MKNLFGIMLLFFIFIAAVIYFNTSQNAENYGAPPYIEDEISSEQDTDNFDEFSNWVRPEGPLKIGLQAGHWKNYELPDELSRIRETGGGTSNGNVAEWEVNLAIANEAKKIIEKEGILVDILPATIPPDYYADAVVAIHADGSANPSTTGFKVAAPRRIMNSKTYELVRIIDEVYQKVTNLERDTNISRNMTGYYAFAWRRFEHSTHPMAPAVILETGFLTNPQEARMLINNPEKPANAIAQALITFLGKEEI